MILPALAHGGYTVESQVSVGDRFGCGRHSVDAVAQKNANRYLVSLKWQQTSGTAEQKVPFELMCLAEALEQPEYSGAYIVLGGEGWKLREFYTSGRLQKLVNMPSAAKVRIVTLERFVALANSGNVERGSLTTG
jgi:hypothetical protein